MNTTEDLLWSWAYNYPSYLGWIFLVITLIPPLIFAILLPLYFIDPHDDTFMPILVFTLSFISSFLLVCIIPIDIFTVSHIEFPGNELISTSVLYFFSLSLIIIFSFMILPFTYSYYKSDLSIRSKSHLRDGILLFIFSFLLFLAILTFSLVFSKDKKDFSYQSIGMFLNIFSILGLFPWNYFTAFGLSLLPMGLIFRQNKQKQQPKQENKIERLREFNSKYILTGKKMTKDEKKEYQELEKESKMYLIEKEMISNDSSIFDHPIFTILRIIAGLLSFIIVIFIVLSLFLNQLDRTIYSTCGFSCGFENKRPANIHNPLDLLLMYSSIFFPLDLIVFFTIIFIIVLSTLTGLSTLSTGVFRTIKWKSTVPQGIISSSIVFTFVLFMFTFNFINFFPQYGTYGSQVYNQTMDVWKLCTMESSTPQCIKTRLYTMIEYSQDEMIFKSVNYYSNWFFILFFIVGLVFSCLNRNNISYKNEQYISLDDNNQENELKEKFGSILE